MVQPQIVERIVAAIRPASGDHLVEIGPGPGALTKSLLRLLPQFTVVELDRDMIAGLRALAPPEQLRVLQADALEVDFAALAGAGNALRIVGNLPYNVATPLIFHILEHAEQVRDMHFMLQKEVVDRVVAMPGSKAYGRLSVMIQAYCAVESLFTVAPGNFFPVPKVDSAFMRLIPHRPGLLPPHLQAPFARIVATSFAQRRKTLANNLRGILSADDLRGLQIDPGSRAETLDQAAFFASPRPPLNRETDHESFGSCREAVCRTGMGSENAARLSGSHLRGAGTQWRSGYFLPCAWRTGAYPVLLASPESGDNDGKTPGGGGVSDSGQLWAGSG
ncbi:16S ribosomal RNA methyltransferase KsgA/Dim1 family protein [Acidithiobacillus sp. GGI-221]|nr:16S ribosomal RNA methyltransferase KsgA/Dim1 family protein [Acidithiobacillus sp. GGI-221]